MKQIPSILIASWMALAPGSVPAVHAVETDKVDHNTFAEFSPGEFDNVTLTGEGHLQLATGITNVATLTDPIIWSAVEDTLGTVYLGTGNQGKIYKLNPKGELSVLFAPNEVMVHALALDHKGRLYAATSPNGRVYRFDAEGHAEVYCNPGETYIWAMVFGKDDTLFLATGNHGKILSVPHTDSTPAKAETYFESEESHISALALDKDGNLLAGTSPHGYLYRIDKANHGFVLFNSGDTEIKQIAVDGDGAIYVSTFVEGPQQKASLSPIFRRHDHVSMGGGDATSKDNFQTGGASSNSRSRLPPRARTPSVERTRRGVRPRRRGAGGMSAQADPPTVPSIASTRLDFMNAIGPQAMTPFTRWHCCGTAACSWAPAIKAGFIACPDSNHWELLQKTSDGAQVSALLPGIGESKQSYAATSHPGWLCRLDLRWRPMALILPKRSTQNRRACGERFIPRQTFPPAPGWSFPPDPGTPRNRKKPGVIGLPRRPLPPKSKSPTPRPDICNTGSSSAAI